MHIYPGAVKLLLKLLILIRKSRNLYFHVAFSSALRGREPVFPYIPPWRYRISTVSIDAAELYRPARACLWMDDRIDLHAARPPPWHGPSDRPESLASHVEEWVCAEGKGRQHVWENVLGARRAQRDAHPGARGCVDYLAFRGRRVRPILASGSARLLSLCVYWAQMILRLNRCVCIIQRSFKTIYIYRNCF